MNRKTLIQTRSRGEASRHRFKEHVTNADALAAQMVAFSNLEGGRIIIGVRDNGTISGLKPADVGRINQRISNAANQGVRSPISPTTENVSTDSGIVMMVAIPKGIDKPYFNRHGVIWLKSGADKRRIVSNEEKRRMFQEIGVRHADELSTRVALADLNRLKLREFLA